MYRGSDHSLDIYDALSPLSEAQIIDDEGTTSDSQVSPYQQGGTRDPASGSVAIGPTSGRDYLNGSRRSIRTSPIRHHKYRLIDTSLSRGSESSPPCWQQASSSSGLCSVHSGSSSLAHPEVSLKILVRGAHEQYKDDHVPTLHDNRTVNGTTPGQNIYWHHYADTPRPAHNVHANVRYPDGALHTPPPPLVLEEMGPKVDVTSVCWKDLRENGMHVEVLRILGDATPFYSSDVIRKRTSRSITPTIARQILSGDRDQIEKAKQVLGLVNRVSPWMNCYTKQVTDEVQEKMARALKMNKIYVRNMLKRRKATKAQIDEIIAADDDGVRELALRYFNLGHQTYDSALNQIKDYDGRN
ncbi:hypothetical protein CBS101457_000304 [Exobasidium rhododendri]|nr:hypothetical protein CBS101457_000304 [Exobasidium rhododendri]